jgi:hypothetical protein
VGDTLRVVRLRSRTSRRASSARTAWLSAEGETPRCAAARVKVPWRTTAAKARISAYSLARTLWLRFKAHADHVA